MQTGKICIFKHWFKTVQYFINLLVVKLPFNDLNQCERIDFDESPFPQFQICAIGVTLEAALEMMSLEEPES